MINTTMNNTIETKEKILDKKPNESAGVHFSSGIKIFDPNTKEIIVQKRGDD